MNNVHFWVSKVVSNSFCGLTSSKCWETMLLKLVSVAKCYNMDVNIFIYRSVFLTSNMGLKCYKTYLVNQIWFQNANYASTIFFATWQAQKSNPIFARVRIRHLLRPRGRPRPPFPRPRATHHQPQCEADWECGPRFEQTNATVSTGLSISMTHFLRLNCSKKLDHVTVIFTFVKRSSFLRFVIKFGFWNCLQDSERLPDRLLISFNSSSTGILLFLDSP